MRPQGIESNGVSSRLIVVPTYEGGLFMAISRLDSIVGRKITIDLGPDELEGLESTDEARMQDLMNRYLSAVESRHGNCYEVLGEIGQVALHDLMSITVLGPSEEIGEFMPAQAVSSR